MKEKALPTTVLILLLTLALSMAAVAASAIGVLQDKAQAGGQWVLSDIQECPAENQVCTEWELASGERKEPACCQDASMVGSTVFHDCTGGQFRQ